ncbi:MAG TPA: DUF4097 family beta strand repeat-containing protein [Candidatus Acidoferrales bacterium]|nr:DUF4097 family beta strand repeat-containing protein [Candidatus Acidoferrales bacterium]
MKMDRNSRWVACTAALLAAVWLAGCGDAPGVTGHFDKNFTVNGPVHLEIANGSGDVHVSTAAGTEVRVHGEVHLHEWGDDKDKMLDSLRTNPPVSQEGNLIRVGQLPRSFSHSSIDYTIEVPPQSEVRCASGSGDVEVDGIQGPATFTSGSGNVTTHSIGGDVQIKTGSGDLSLDQVQGQVQVTTGSGDIEVHTVKGAVRLSTGSGDIVITHPGDNVVADTGSGDVDVSDVVSDLRLHTGSGDIKVNGNPGAMNYWDLHASSGNVTLNVPQSASFRLYAHTGSGDINPQIPVVMEGTVGKNELRARIGDGKARVEIETGSGTIELD